MDELRNANTVFYTDRQSLSDSLMGYTHIVVPIEEVIFYLCKDANVLKWAIYHGHVDLVQRLLDAGIRDAESLDWAVWKNRLVITKMLLDAGIKGNKPNDFVCSEEMKQLLERYDVL